MIPQYILDDSLHYPSSHRLGQPRLGQREYDWSGLEQILQELRDRYRLIFEVTADYPPAPPRLRQATEEEIEAGRKAAKTRNITPVYEGERLGSAESFTFYKGVASVYPKFRNPYGST